MTTFIGLDLAWTSHRDTGICVFVGGRPDALRCVRLESSVCWVDDLATQVTVIPGPLVVAVDVPLIVTRRRWVERQAGNRSMFLGLRCVEFAVWVGYESP